METGRIRGIFALRCAAGQGVRCVHEVEERSPRPVDVHVVSLSEKLPLASDPIPVQLAAAESPDSGWDRLTMAFPRLHEIHGVPVPPSSPDYRTLPARVLFSLQSSQGAEAAPGR